MKRPTNKMDPATSHRLLRSLRKKTPSAATLFLCIFLLPRLALAHDPSGLILAVVSGAAVVHGVTTLVLSAIMTAVFYPRVEKKRQIFVPTLLVTFFGEFALMLFPLSLGVMGDSGTIGFYFGSVTILATTIGWWRAHRSATKTKNQNVR